MERPSTPPQICQSRNDAIELGERPAELAVLGPHDQKLDPIDRQFRCLLKGLGFGPGPNPQRVRQQAHGANTDPVFENDGRTHLSADPHQLYGRHRFQ